MGVKLFSWIEGSALTFNLFSSLLPPSSRAARVAAIILHLARVLSCFLHDLARPGGQKFVMKPAHATPAEEPT